MYAAYIQAKLRTCALWISRAVHLAWGDVTAIGGRCTAGCDAPKTIVPHHSPFDIACPTSASLVTCIYLKLLDDLLTMYPLQLQSCTVVAGTLDLPWACFDPELPSARLKRIRKIRLPSGPERPDTQIPASCSGYFLATQFPGLGGRLSKRQDDPDVQQHGQAGKQGLVRQFDSPIDHSGF